MASPLPSSLRVRLASSFLLFLDWCLVVVVVGSPRKMAVVYELDQCFISLRDKLSNKMVV